MSDLKKAASELRDTATWLNQIADEFERHAEQLADRERQFEALLPIFTAMNAVIQPHQGTAPSSKPLPGQPVKEAESRRPAHIPSGPGR